MSYLQAVKNPQSNLYQVPNLETFRNNLANHGIELTRKKCTTLQVNVGQLWLQS